MGKCVTSAIGDNWQHASVWVNTDLQPGSRCLGAILLQPGPHNEIFRGQRVPTPSRPEASVQSYPLVVQHTVDSLSVAFHAMPFDSNFH